MSLTIHSAKYFLVFSFFIISLFSSSLVYSAPFTRSFPEWNWDLQLDFRGAYTDNEVSWLDGGLGKNRYGSSNNGDSRLLGRFSEASFIFAPRFSKELSAFIQFTYTPEQKENLDIVESFVFWKHAITDSTLIKTRIGAFLPPISLENTATAWSSPYTITSSSINSWVGEELKTIGLEATIKHKINNNNFSWLNAVYRANDPAGSLLAWRGFSLNDNKSGIFAQLPLAKLPSLSASGSFPNQAPWVEPIEEIDSRLGYYTGVQWNQGNSKINILYYDNRGNPTAFDGKQYAWDTHFTHIGMAFELPFGITSLTQYMNGNTFMGEQPTSVDADFWSFYSLVSKNYNQHRFTLRYDQFKVSDRDDTPDDDNSEKGISWTLAYGFQYNENYSLQLETLYIDSTRQARTYLGNSANNSELLFQLNFRVNLSNH